MKGGMRNFMVNGYNGVTETWNVLQHEVERCLLCIKMSSCFVFSSLVVE